MSGKSAWSKPDIKNLVARKKVDQSIFKHGMHIPIIYREYFIDWLDIDEFKKGDKQKIKLEFNNFTAYADIRNMNVKSPREIIQIRYNKYVANYLQKEMQDTYEMIKNKNNDDIEINEALEFYYGEEKNVFEVKIINLDEKNDLIKEQETNYIVEDVIEQIHEYISSKGYFYSIDIIKNLYLSLKTKPFVILAGISGTGKSKLVELFADAVGANMENKRYSLIPVKPDWSDGSDLLGFKNIEGEFLRGPFTTIVKNATENPTKPYFVCLDEMNLARVEYYFSDILSLMETRKDINNKIVTERLFRSEDFGEDKDSRDELETLYIPNNLYIIGTVNMDETTFPFSKKVLDRANTIEFSEVNLAVDFDSLIIEDEEMKVNDIENKVFFSEYIKIIDCIEERDIVEKTINVLQDINMILEEENMHFAYRVRDEICFYVIYAVTEDLMSFEEALDYGILQKILPKIQGSNINIKSLLVNIFNTLNEKEVEFDVYDNDANIKVKRVLDRDQIDYPLTSQKLYKMIRRFELDGFTTFWE